MNQASVGNLDNTSLETVRLGTSSKRSVHGNVVELSPASSVRRADRRVSHGDVDRDQSMPWKSLKV